MPNMASSLPVGGMWNGSKCTMWTGENCPQSELPTPVIAQYTPNHSMQRAPLHIAPSVTEGLQSPITQNAQTGLESSIKPSRL